MKLKITAFMVNYNPCLASPRPAMPCPTLLSPCLDRPRQAMPCAAVPCPVHNAIHSLSLLSLLIPEYCRSDLRNRFLVIRTLIGSVGTAKVTLLVFTRALLNKICRRVSARVVILEWCVMLIRIRRPQDDFRYRRTRSST